MSERFTISPTPLPDLVLVERTRRGDYRGFLSRLYCGEDLREAGFDSPIAQINHTCTHRRGAIRGMHFQHAPYAEDKFVSVLRGAVFDVAVDLRPGPAFLAWHGEILSANNARSLFIPKGFAHGFQTLEEDCELLYLHTAPYTPEAEDGLNPFDDRIAIDWPLPDAQLSDRDRAHPMLGPDFSGVDTR